MENTSNDESNHLSWKENLGVRIRKKLVEPEFEAMSRRFSNTSRFVVSSQVWTNMIPTRDCDILMTFPKNTDDDILMWVLTRLKTRAPELSVHVRHHSYSGVYGFYLTTSFDNLLKGAEELSIRKPVKNKNGGGMKEFLYSDQEYFEGIEDPKTFFTTQERQSIVKQMAFDVRGQDGDILGKFKFLDGQAIIPLLVSKEIIKDVLPLHNNDDLTHLRKTWVQAIFRSQPLDKIRDYFGLKIAMYFGYLGHYTKSLIFPTIFGMVLWFLSGKDQYSDDLYFVIFASINVLWATLYLESWKRTSAEHAYNWGVDVEDELLVEPRPLYHGSIIKSKVTGRLEPHYPGWKRNLFRYFISGPIILLCLSVVFSVMWGIFAFQDWINSQVLKENLPSPCKFIPKIMLAVSIGVLDDIYKKIAYWLNDQENYRLQETYENNLIIKLVLFQFVNSFLSLFYIAFYLQDMDRLKDQLAALLITRQVIGNIKEAFLPFVLEKLKLFKIGYKMTKDMSKSSLDKQAKEILDKNLRTDTSKDESAGDPPKENEQSACKDNTKDEKDTSTQEETKANQKTEKICDIAEDKPAVAKKESIKNFLTEDVTVGQGGPHLSQAEVEAAMKPYEDTFEDHLEMFIQFGYVTLFSSAFPLAALCAILNNVIEIRSDAFKLCTSMQRPFGQRVAGIGTWQDALELMSIIAVMVNCAMIGMSDFADRLFPDFTTAERIILIVILEHVVLTLKLMLAYAIPDLPDWVAEEKARLEYLRRDALKKLETKNTTPTTTSVTALTSKSSSLTSSYTSRVNTHNRGYDSNNLKGSSLKSLSTSELSQGAYPKLTMYSYKNYLAKDPRATSVKQSESRDKNTTSFVKNEYYDHSKDAAAGKNLQSSGYSVKNDPVPQKPYSIPTCRTAPRSSFSSTWSSSSAPSNTTSSMTKGGYLSKEAEESLERLTRKYDKESFGKPSQHTKEEEAHVDRFMSRNRTNSYEKDPGIKQENLLTKYSKSGGNDEPYDGRFMPRQENLLTRYCKGIVDDNPPKVDNKSKIEHSRSIHQTHIPVSSSLVHSIEKSKMQQQRENEYKESQYKQEKIMGDYKDAVKSERVKESEKVTSSSSGNGNSGGLINKFKGGITRRRSGSTSKGNTEV